MEIYLLSAILIIQVWIIWRIHLVQRNQVRGHGALDDKISFLEEMLKGFFGIKWSFDDFKTWVELHPEDRVIPVVEGELHNFKKMVSPSLQLNDVTQTVTFRGMDLKLKDKQ